MSGQRQDARREGPKRARGTGGVAKKRGKTKELGKGKILESQPEKKKQQVEGKEATQRRRGGEANPEAENDATHGGGKTSTNGKH